MSNDYFNATGNPATNSAGTSSLIRAEFAAIQSMAEKLPSLLGNGNKVVTVNAGGTALQAVTTLTGLLLTASAFNGTVGATTPSTIAATTISATGQITSTLATGTAPFVVASTTNVANLNASSLNGATFAVPGPIGSTTPSTGAFTTLSATGNVGVNTASPVSLGTNVATLDITNTAGGGIRFRTSGAGNSGYLQAIATGIDFGTTDALPIRFVTNSATQATLDTSGNLGIGVTPSAWGGGYKAFQGFATTVLNGVSGVTNLGDNYYYNGTNNLYLTSNYATKYLQNSGAHSWYTAPSGTAGNAITFTQAMTLDASGNLYGANAVPVVNRVNGWALGAAGSFNIRSASAASAWGLNATSGTHVTFYTDNGSTYVSAGVITSSGSVTSYTGTSDYRLKDNQAPITPEEATAFVMSLQPKRWVWTTDGRPDAGFIAHELAVTSKNSVFGEKDAVDEKGEPVYQSADPSSPEIIANLTAMVQSLQSRLTALEAA